MTALPLFWKNRCRICFLKRATPPIISLKKQTPENATPRTWTRPSSVFISLTCSWLLEPVVQLFWNMLPVSWKALTQGGIFRVRSTSRNCHVFAVVPKSDMSVNNKYITWYSQMSEMMQRNKNFLFDAFTFCIRLFVEGRWKPGGLGRWKPGGFGVCVPIYFWDALSQRSQDASEVWLWNRLGIKMKKKHLNISCIGYKTSYFCCSWRIRRKYSAPFMSEELFWLYWVMFFKKI